MSETRKDPNMTSTPAEVFGSFKHQVPTNATVPDGVEVLRMRPGGRAAHILDTRGRQPENRDSYYTYWSKEPITPPLPTEVGTVLHGVEVEVEGIEGTHTAMLTPPASADDTLTWLVALASEYHWAGDDDILSWTLATAPDGTQTPGPGAKPRDVMDEDDKSPVVDRDGNPWVWSDGEWVGWGAPRATKAAIDVEYGPLRFADETKRCENNKEEQ